MIRLPPSLIPSPHQPKQRANVSSLLIVSSHVNKLHFFTNGTIYLGTTSLPPQVRLTNVRLLNKDAPDSVPLDAHHRGGVRLELVWLDASSNIGFGTLDLLPSIQPLHPSPSKSSTSLNVFKIKPSLSVIGINSRELDEQVQLSTEIQSILKDCFFTYFGIVKDWHIARLAGRKWFEAFEEVSKAHQVLAPMNFQMLQLLFTGQASEGLRDFLGTKNGDRVFTKWETSVNGNLTRIRLAIIKLLVPAVERLYILSTEMRLHTYPQFSPLKLVEDDDFEVLLLVENLITHLVKAVHMLDQLVQEEEDLFGHFCKWLRSEFDHITALENSQSTPSRPAIKHDLMAVSQFIKRGDFNPLDNVIFSQFPLKIEDLKSMHEKKDQLAKKFYEDYFDTQGSEKRAELKKKLIHLLSSSEEDANRLEKGGVNKQKDAPFVERSSSVGTYVTPDASHFQQPRPNAEFQTPSFADHLKRQKDFSFTPSNFSTTKPLFPPTSEPDTQSSSSSSSQLSQLHAKTPATFLSNPPWGIYTSLSYSSMFIAEVFGKMFSKIATSKTVEPISLRSSTLPIKPSGPHLCSRFVEDFHYSAFVSSTKEAGEILVVDRVKLYLQEINPELEQHQITIDSILPTGYLENVQDHRRSVQVLDLEFFDHFELVLLAQVDSGFSAQYVLITFKFGEIFDSRENHLSQLPIHRFHQLGSDFKPEQISLNGAKGRRTGCVMSGEGRMIHVFDMEDTS